jgi:hypothetical protein
MLIDLPESPVMIAEGRVIVNIHSRLIVGGIKVM